MPKKIAPLVSQFCRRKHNENESEVVYPQIIFKSSDLLEQFDLSGIRQLIYLVLYHEM